MLHFYHFPSPNCLKVAIMLEECELSHRRIFTDILDGAQFAPDFLSISPNNKVPALLDDDDPQQVASLFESGAILEYLAEKSGRFLSAKRLWEIKAWLHWQVGGLGPMAGQAHHFRKFAPEKISYAIKRYTDEVNRLYGVLETRLQERAFIADEVSIADFACWPWVRHHEWQGQSLDNFPNIKRWFHSIGQRDGVIAALEKSKDTMAPKESYKVLYGQTAATAEKMQKAKRET